MRHEHNFSEIIPGKEAGDEKKQSENEKEEPLTELPQTPEGASAPESPQQGAPQANVISPEPSTEQHADGKPQRASLGPKTTQNNNLAGMPPQPPTGEGSTGGEPPEKSTPSSYGALIGIVIIVGLLIIGGLYFWGKVVSEREQRAPGTIETEIIEEEVVSTSTEMLENAATTSATTTPPETGTTTSTTTP